MVVAAGFALFVLSMLMRPISAAAAGGFIAPPVFGSGTQALVVFTGGTVDELEAASRNARSSGAWVQDARGAYHLLVIDGPSFLKDMFRANFPQGFLGATSVSLTVSAPVAASPAAPSPLWTASDSPPGGALVRGAKWVRFAGPAGTQMYAAVFTPNGPGPFPAVVFLHGTEGLRATHEIQLAADVSASGSLVTVTVCWFAGNWNVQGPDFNKPYAVTYADAISCPDAPSIGHVVETAVTSTTQDAIGAAVRMVRTLPAVDPQRVGLFGHSRGSAAAVVYGAQTGGVVGVVAAAGYPLLSPALIRTRPPLLILQGTADDEVGAARQFESGVRAGGWRIDSHYYEGSDHFLFYNDPTRADAVTRIATFFR